MNTHDTEAARESGYGQLLRLVAATIESADPDAARSLQRAAGDVEEFIAENRALVGRVAELEGFLRCIQVAHADHLQTGDYVALGIAAQDALNLLESGGGGAER